MVYVFLSLGSNVGNRRANLKKARAALSHTITILIGSPIYSTMPVGMSGKRVFNQILLCKTTNSPNQLLDKTQEIELELGRSPQEKGKCLPRRIDIDILTYGSLKVNSPRITLPHPKMFSRVFVLVPLEKLLTKIRAANPALYSKLSKSFVKKVFTARKALSIEKNAIRAMA